MGARMGRTLDEVMAGLPVRRRRRVEAQAAELIAEEMTLRELRRAMGRTQVQVARATGKPQATISRMEAQADMLLSNLDQVVTALGGRIRILAELPGRAPVLLTGLRDITPPARRPPVRAPAQGASKPTTRPRRRDTASEPDGTAAAPSRKVIRRHAVA